MVWKHTCLYDKIPDTKANDAQLKHEIDTSFSIGNVTLASITGFKILVPDLRVKWMHLI